MSMSYKGYRAAVGRREEKQGECPYTQTAMLGLHQAVIEENRRQKAKKYSLRDERGETFSLAYWSDYEQKETVLIPAGTPINIGNLELASKELVKSMRGTDFGRWTGADRERSMAEIERLIAELAAREKEEAANG